MFASRGTAVNPCRTAAVDAKRNAQRPFYDYLFYLIVYVDFKGASDGLP
jgi:hypothetical protein